MWTDEIVGTLNAPLNNFTTLYTDTGLDEHTASSFKLLPRRHMKAKLFPCLCPLRSIADRTGVNQRKHDDVRRQDLVALGDDTAGVSVKSHSVT